MVPGAQGLGVQDGKGVVCLFVCLLGFKSKEWSFSTDSRTARLVAGGMTHGQADRVDKEAAAAWLSTETASQPKR